MLRRESAILLGIGTTRRKFALSEETTSKGEQKDDMYVCVPINRYVAIKSGKLCQGKVNHKCLFNKDDTLDLLCPDTVQSDGRATVFVHREYMNRDILAQRNINIYMGALCFKAAGLAEFRVVHTGRAMLGEREECVCIQPVAGTNLWIDKRLVFYTTRSKDITNITNVNNTNANNNGSGNDNDVNSENTGQMCDEGNSMYNDDGKKEECETKESNGKRERGREREKTQQ